MLRLLNCTDTAMAAKIETMLPELDTRARTCTHTSTQQLQVAPARTQDAHKHKEKHTLTAK